MIEHLIEAGQILGQLHCLPATDGNLSARISDDEFVATRSGCRKSSLTVQDFVTIRQLKSTPAGASSEWELHNAIYSARKEVNCILHAHPRSLTAFSIAHRLPNIALLAECLTHVGELALVPFERPGRIELGKRTLEQSGTASVYVLANHGAVSVGSSVAEALHRLERAEFLAAVEIRAHNVGRAIPLSPELESELSMSYASRV